MADDDDSLKELDQSIQKVKERLDNELKQKEVSNAGIAGKIIADVIAGVTVGIAIGYYTDVFFGTSPFFLIICFIFGVLGAFVNIFKLVTEEQSK